MAPKTYTRTISSAGDPMGGYSIQLQINDVLHSFDEAATNIIVLKETDSLAVQVACTADAMAPIIRFEDYEVTAELVTQGTTELLYRTPTITYLSECFGKVVLRVQIGNLVFPIVLDVLARKTSVEQAKKMIKYLAEFSPNLIKACLARSSIPMGNSPSDHIEPELLIATAESFISFLQSSQQELVSNIREKLVAKRLPLSTTNKLTSEVDPADLIENLDSLVPALTIGDVSLRGRKFDLGDIYVSALQSTADVKENHVILGALYSMRTKLLGLRSLLQESPLADSGSPAGYESFSRLLLSLTAEGMIQRCEVCLTSIDGFIGLLEKRLGVTYQGELIPVMSPFVRSTRVYRSLYSQIAEWYALGVPDVGTIRFLMKMKSLSKIYELFTFFHLFEELTRSGWILASSTPHPEYGEYMPCVVDFINGDQRLNIRYEPKIRKYSETTETGDLIDVGHRANADNPYWTPDFVLRWTVAGELRYIILDAKYSTSNSVRQYALPALYSKYYEGTAVYDGKTQTASNLPIKAVIAIYALEWNNPSYISKWEYQGINSRLPRIPAIGGVGLMTDNDSFFSKCFARIMELGKLSPGLADIDDLIKTQAAA